MRMPSLHAVCGLTAVVVLGGGNATAAPLGSHTEKWINLQVGECVADLPPVDLSRVTITVVDRTADPTPSTLICLLQNANGQPLTGSARH